MANIPKGQPCVRQVTLLASAARAATSSGDTIPAADAYTAADILLDVTAASGTAPTLDVYIQKLLPDGATWQDIIHFDQVTTSTGKWICSFVMNPTTAPAAIQTAALTAGTQYATLMGNTIRVSYVIGGTNPSYTFSVKGDFYS